jgi:hypothetical protein
MERSPPGHRVNLAVQKLVLGRARFLEQSILGVRILMQPNRRKHAETIALTEGLSRGTTDEQVWVGFAAVTADPTRRMLAGLRRARSANGEEEPGFARMARREIASGAEQA